jgi:hypothetical protein
VIYISRINGGPELRGSRVDEALAKLSRSVRGGKAETLGDFGSLDIVFHVAGSLLQPEHIGVRTGRFSKRKRMVQVQIAVPAEVVASSDPYPFVARGLLEAVKAAGAVFAKAGIAYPLDEYAEVVERAMRIEIH